MRKFFAVQFIFLILTTLFFVSCGKDSVQLEVTKANTNTYSGYVAVSNSAINAVTLFDTSGSFVKVIRDVTNGGEVPYGLFAESYDKIFAVIDGTDRVEVLKASESTNTGVTTFTANANLTAVPVQGIGRDSSGNIYVAESSINTIEKFDSNGARVGSPFISAAVGGCTIPSTPRHIAVASNGNIAVTMAGSNRLNIYGSTGTTCVASLSTAPFGANVPFGVGYNAVYDKFIVAFNTSGAIVAVSSDGATVNTIYTDTTTLAAPVAVSNDNSGNIYVASTTYNTVEKLNYSGGTTATRSGNSPFISTSTFIRTPTGLTVIP